MNELTRLMQARALGRDGRGRSLREGTGLSLREVAEAIEVDQATLLRWERGTTRPRRAAALRWLLVLESVGALPSGMASGHVV